jgi:hypothetical protein
MSFATCSSYELCTVFPFTRVTKAYLCQSIVWGMGVIWGLGVVWSFGVVWKFGVVWSLGVVWTLGVNWGFAVVWRLGIAATKKKCVIFSKLQVRWHLYC